MIQRLRRAIPISTLLHAFRVFKPALQGQRSRIVKSILLSIVAALLELARPWPIKFVFDYVLNDLRPDSLIPKGISSITLLAFAAVAVFLIPILIGAANLRSLVTSAEVGRKVSTRIRRRVFEHLHRLEFPFHQDSKTGDLLVRVMGDVNMVRDLLFASWASIIERAVLLLGTTSLMLALDADLTLLSLAPLPVLGVLLFKSSKRLKAVTRRQRDKEGDAASHAAESLQQIEVVKAFAAENDATHRFVRNARAGEKAGVKAARISAKLNLASEMLSGAGLAVVIFFGGLRMMQGAITLGTLIIFMTYVRNLYRPLRRFSRDGMRLSKAAACAERLLSILMIKPEPRGLGLEAPRFPGRIEIRNLSFTHQNGTRALDDLTLDVPKGSLIVLKGPNGSGKSTLLSILLRLFIPQTGQVLIDGQPIQRFELESYRRAFAYVPQSTLLFSGTLRENILVGEPRAGDAEIEKAVEMSLLNEVVDRLPEGLDSAIGEGGSMLSGGEAKRLMLARAAVRRSSILLLDEPLAGLDPDSRKKVAAAVRRIVAGRTTIVVSHESVDEITPDLVVSLHEGTVSELTHATSQ